MATKKRAPVAAGRTALSVINDAIESTPLAALREHPLNPRQGDVGAVVQSIEANGFYGAIVAQRSTGYVLAGNHRMRAAKQLGFTELPVVWVDVDDERAKRILLADNRTSDLGGYDDALLADLLKDLAETPDCLRGTGYDGDDLDELLASVDPPPSAGASDDAPEVDEQGEPDSRQGEVYELGPHRLVCGDCRTHEAWALLLGGERANVVFTSPPYASQRKYDESSGFRPIRPDDYVDWWEPLQALVREHLAEDGSFFVNIKEHCEDGQRHLYVKDLTIAHVRRWGWKFIDELCWRDTKNGVPGEYGPRFKDAWEPVFHFSAGKPRINHEAVSTSSEYSFDYSPDTKTVAHEASWKTGAPAGGYKAGLARASNVIEIAASSGSEHSAAFPVALPEFFVKAFSDPSDVILDPFLGSGTTLIAAAKHGRRGFGMEISPRYCDVIRRRWTRYANENGLDPGPGALDG